MSKFKRVLFYILSMLNYARLKIMGENPDHPFKVIWIDPKAVKYSIESSPETKSGWYQICGVIRRNDWERKINLPKKFIQLEELFTSWFVLKENPDDSIYFNSNPSAYKKYKRIYPSIFKEIKRNGFKVPRPTDSNIDPFYVGINKDGQILFITGKHRLALARAVGLKKIPAYVSRRHYKWAEQKKMHIKGEISLDENHKNHPDIV